MHQTPSWHSLLSGQRYIDHGTASVSMPGTIGPGDLGETTFGDPAYGLLPLADDPARRVGICGHSSRATSLAAKTGSHETA